jgi:ubiquinone/menaquinone biosynthesis C-methylase UbiE
MVKEISSQYDRFAGEFVEGTNRYNETSRAEFYSMLNFDMRGKRILDVGCGDGYDIALYRSRGAIVYGIDASRELVSLAKRRVPKAEAIQGLMESLPYGDAVFDMVLSKYALQTSTDIPQVLRELGRVLKPNGIIAYLAVHPLRQFMEKKKHPKDYFLQEVVESRFFGGTVTAREPTHTLNEYLNPEFLAGNRIVYFKECGDFPSSEKVEGDTYPCFFVLKAKKIA